MLFVVPPQSIDKFSDGENQIGYVESEGVVDNADSDKTGFTVTPAVGEVLK
jgi:hypothetical protein